VNTIPAPVTNPGRPRKTREQMPIDARIVKTSDIERWRQKARILDYIETQRIRLSEPSKDGPHYYGNLTLQDAIELVMATALRKRDEE
jgi:hypothetical protein